MTDVETNITEACQNPWNALARTINARNKIHSGPNPVKGPHNGEL